MLLYEFHFHTLIVILTHFFNFLSTETGGYQQPPPGGYQQSQAPPPAAATQPPPASKPTPTDQVSSKMAKLNVNEETGHGTIKAPASIDPEADATVLRNAMKGLGECMDIYDSITVHVLNTRVTVCVYLCTFV